MVSGPTEDMSNVTSTVESCRRHAVPGTMKSEA